MNSYPILDSFNETYAFIITLFRNVCFSVRNYKYYFYTNDTQKLKQKLKITSIWYLKVNSFRYLYH